MASTSRRLHSGRWPTRWTATTLYRGALVAVLFVAAVATAQAAGLFEKLFTGRAAQRTEAPSQENAALATVRLTVEGMVCYGWPPNVKRALERLDGVVQADVSFEEKTATVQYDPQKVTPEQMIAAVNGIGFRASLQKPPADTRYQGQGTVVAIDLKKGTVTLDHGEIEGLMPAMVMEFVVDSRDALRGLKLGDRVTFTLKPRGVTVTIVEMAVVKK